MDQPLPDKAIEINAKDTICPNCKGPIPHVATLLHNDPGARYSVCYRCDHELHIN